MYNRFKNLKNKEKGQGLVEYALILVLVAIVVIAALMILGPIIGNVFSKINSSLTTVSAGGAAAAAPANTAYDSYTGIARMGNTYAIEAFCNTAGSGAAYNSYAVGSGWDVAAGPNVPPSTINGGSNTLVASGNCP
jgi:pilus assembly protein Flp/PilA